MKTKVLSVLMFVVLTISTSCFAATYTSNIPMNQGVVNYQQQRSNVTNNVNINFNGSGVNYEKGYVFATGTGVMDYGSMIGSEEFAREAAIVDAQRYLVGAIDGARIDAETTIEMKRLKSDIVKRKITGVVRNAMIVDEGFSKNGQSYYVKMIMPLYGNNSVADAVFSDMPAKAPEPVPQVVTPVIPQPEVKRIQNERYTGLVIDAVGCGLEPAMSPVILDTNGRKIYGHKNIDADFAVQKGMVAYARNTSEVSFGDLKERVGWNPLIIKAVGAAGGVNAFNKVNVVVTPEDGDRILLANNQGHFLENCAVIFVR